MNYKVVKQFYNHFVDDIFNLFFKSIDFGKLLWTVFLAFIELWQILFSIFINLFMYIYYFFLFSIDSSIESNPFRKRGGAKNKYSLRKIKKQPISTRSRTFSATYSSTLSTPEISNNISALKSRPTSGKTPIIKGTLEFLDTLLNEIINFFSNIFKKIMSSIPEPKKSGKMDMEIQQSKGLIDDYLKEYNKAKKM